MTTPSFEALVGRPAAVEASAPGRVNLIGEHTDYSGGFVLPVAIRQRTHVEAAPRDDGVVRLWSAQFPQDDPETYELGAEARLGTWADYVRGMTWALGQQGPLRGFDARIESGVPVGSGLSSSAALEIALGRALCAMFALEISGERLALTARRAENEFVGAPTGIMDQMACSLADEGTALLLDTRTLEHARVPLPAAAALAVIDSGIRHDHARGEYATRRQECAAAAARLGVAELRDVPPGRLDDVARLPEPLNRRARHVVTENQRVLDAVAALTRGDLAAVGQLFARSHASMRDDFEISLPPIDRLVALAAATEGVYGARLTGGGFGGSVVLLAEAGRAEGVAADIVRRYRAAGHEGTVVVPA